MKQKDIADNFKALNDKVNSLTEKLDLLLAKNTGSTVQNDYKDSPKYFVEKDTKQNFLYSYYVVLYAGNLYQVDATYKVVTKRNDIQIKNYKEVTRDLVVHPSLVIEKLKEDKRIKSYKKDVFYLKELYEKKGFGSFLDEAKRYNLFLEEYDKVDVSKEEFDKHNEWDETVSDEKSFWSRLFNAVAFFNVNKIAKQITYINSHSDNINERITSVGVPKDKEANYNSWYRQLYDDLERVVELVVNLGEADETNSYENFQSGRVHLDSILYNWKDKETKEHEVYPIIKLYWTDEETTAGDNY